MGSYFVASVPEMPGLLNQQAGTFYTVKSAVDAADAAQQTALAIVAAGKSCPPFLLAVPAAHAQAVYLTPVVAATPVPSPVTPNLTATPVPLGVHLDWTLDPNVRLYAVERAFSQAGPFSVISQQTSAGFNDSNLQPATPVYYTVIAGNVNGTAQSSEVSATPNAPSAPVLTSTTGTSPATVALSWTGSVSATEYQIQRGTATGEETTVATVTELGYTDTGLATGTTYYYTVTAVTPSGSYQSNEVSVAPH